MYTDRKERLWSSLSHQATNGIDYGKFHLSHRILLIAFNLPDIHKTSKIRQQGVEMLRTLSILTSQSSTYTSAKFYIASYTSFQNDFISACDCFILFISIFSSISNIESTALILCKQSVPCLHSLNYELRRPSLHPNLVIIIFWFNRNNDYYYKFTRCLSWIRDPKWLYYS